MSSAIESPSNSGQTLPETQPNTVATIGAVLTGVSFALCGLLFYWADQLPNTIEEFQHLETDSPTQLRILILGCSTGVLAFVAWVLCMVGLLLPNRQRLLAAVSAVLSAIVVFGVFGVLILGAVLNPTVSDATQPFTETPETENVQGPPEQNP